MLPAIYAITQKIGRKSCHEFRSRTLGEGFPPLEPCPVPQGMMCEGNRNLKYLYSGKAVDISVVALVADLFFAERVMKIAETVGEDVTMCGTVKELRDYITQERPDMALVDLSLLGDDDLPWVKEVPHVAGFGPHVDRTRFQSAKAGGIYPLWANSALSQRLGPWIVATRTTRLA